MKYEFNGVWTKVGVDEPHNIDEIELELGCFQAESEVEGDNNTCGTCEEYGTIVCYVGDDMGVFTYLL